MFQHPDAWLPPLSGLPESETKALFFDTFARSTDVADALMRTDEQNWLIDEALARADHMSMAASVEVRVPLLDLEVAALAHALPRSYKTSLWGTKRILKDAFRTVLPKEVLAQPKRGWFSPGAKWLRRPEFIALADEILSDQYTSTSTLFNLPEVRRALHEHREKRSYHFTNLWAVLVFLSWSKEYSITI
jgi:asparagine synthase (glutamine-hydrolysing)